MYIVCNECSKKVLTEKTGGSCNAACAYTHGADIYATHPITVRSFVLLLLM